MNIGDKFVIVAKRGLFATQKSMWSGDGPTVHSIDGLTFIQIEVIEERQVKGDYTDATHFGFRAKGSDGFFYLNQWDFYDEASMDPRSNWLREFIEGVNKSDLLLNWDVRSVLNMWDEDQREEVLNHIRVNFPESEITYCQKTGIAINGVEYSHIGRDDSPIYFYKTLGCLFCKMEER